MGQAGWLNVFLKSEGAFQWIQLPSEIGSTVAVLFSAAAFEAVKCGFVYVCACTFIQYIRLCVCAHM